LAAVLSDNERFKGKKIGLILCGGNIDSRMLSSLLLRGMVRSGRMKRLRVELVDVPGQLVDLSSAIAKAGGNVVDVAYHRTFSDLPAKITYIDISVEALDADHMSSIIDTVRAQGFTVSIASY
jgi:threonine dehydratase